MRYRITVRGEGVELRGYIDDVVPLPLFASDMEPYGIVAASEAEIDYNPFPPSIEDSMALIARFVEMNNGVDLGDLVESMAGLHSMQARVIQGERARADAAEAELRDRELHHFEVEEENARLRAVFAKITAELDGHPIPGGPAERIRATIAEATDHTDGSQHG